MQEVKEWLDNENRTAADGVALYGKYGRNPNIKKHLDRCLADKRRNADCIAKCIWELGKIANVKPILPATVAKVGAQAPAGDQELGDKTPDATGANLIFGDSALVDLTKLPAPLQEKYVGIKDAWKFISELHTILQNETTTEEERAEALDQMLAAKDSIDESWAQIRAFCDVTPEAKKVEELPENPNVTGQQLIDAYKRLVLVRGNISRAQKELETLKDAKAIGKRKDSIAGWEKEIEECKATLAGFQF